MLYAGDISRGVPLRGLYPCRPTYVYIDIMQILARAGNVSSAFDVPLFCPRYVHSPNFSIPH